MIDISKIKDLNALTEQKNSLKQDINAKEQDLSNDYNYVKQRITYVSKPFNMAKTIGGLVLSYYSGSKGQSLAYKAGYTLASKLFKRKK